MNWGSISKRWVCAGLVALALGASVGCRTTEKDVERWANTKQGPTKLVAVLSHDKYETPLRVDAAMTLIGMQPRQGRRIGIDLLVDALEQLSPGERGQIVAGVVPQLVEQLGKSPPNEEGAEDPSIPYKDAAFLLLTNEGAVLVADTSRQELLKRSLIDWAMQDFAGRMDASSQMVGMQQMLRKLGSDSVTQLPDLIVPEGQKTDRIAQILAEIGDAETKLRASSKLVAVAQEVASQAWLDRKAPGVKQANKESGIEIDDKRFQAQLLQYQEEELLRVFASMKRVAGRPAVDFLMSYATNTSNPPKLRAGALAALENNLSRDDSRSIETLLNLAGEDETPDAVRDLALRRVGEMPRQQVIGRLYDLFDAENWKVRWLAGELALKMSDASHVGEFMERLAKVENMSIAEPLRYGKLIGELKGGESGRTLVAPYLGRDNKASVRVTALGYYYAFGTAAQLADVQAFAKEKVKVPTCAKDAKDCEWVCARREIETIGEYVEHCIVPAMQARKKEPAKPAEKESE